MKNLITRAFELIWRAIDYFIVTTARYTIWSAVFIASSFGTYYTYGRLASVEYNVALGAISQGTIYNQLYIRAVLALADDDDTVNIRITSPGGSVFQTMQIVNSIKSSDAHVITTVDVVAYSGGAIIAMAGDEIRTEEFGELLFHRARIDFGLFIKIVEEGSPLTVSLNGYCERYVFPYLTNKEIKAYKAGEDVIIDAQDMVQRIKEKK